jgi:hypothetical protein
VDRRVLPGALNEDDAGIVDEDEQGHVGLQGAVHIIKVPAALVAVLDWRRALWSPEQALLIMRGQAVALR